MRGPNSVVVEFPQYSGSESTLSRQAALARLSETDGLHGGVGGGLRVPTAEDCHMWAQVRHSVTLRCKDSEYCAVAYS